MHELSLCRTIHGIVSRAAQERPVARIHVRVGQLRQVVPDTLTYCWGLVAADTPLAGAALAVESVPVTVRCGDCAAETVVEHRLVLVCRVCGSGSTTVIAGEEFLITHLDLVLQET